MDIYIISCLLLVWRILQWLSSSVCICEKGFMQDKFSEVELLSHRAYAFISMVVAKLQRLYSLHFLTNMFESTLFHPTLTNTELYQTSVKTEFHSFFSYIGKAPDFTD